MLKLKQDFKKLFSDKENIFKDRWPVLKQTILDHLVNAKISCIEDKAYLNLLPTLPPGYFSP